MARQTKAEIAAIAAANLKAEQQAELKRLRAEKAAKTRAANREAAAKAAAHVANVQPAASAADIEQLIDDLELPSAKRVLVGLILGVAASFTVGYGIGMLLSYAIAGIMTLTATPWIAFALTVVAWVIAIYAAWKIGGRVGGAVFASVVMPEGLASRSYESVANAASNAKTSLLGVFSTSKEKAIAQYDAGKAKLVNQFSGAHTTVRAA